MEHPHRFAWSHSLNRSSQLGFDRRIALYPIIRNVGRLGYNNTQPKPAKVLLMLEVPVDREEDVKLRFGPQEKFPVFQPFPTLVRDRPGLVARKRLLQTRIHGLV